MVMDENLVEGDEINYREWDKE